MIGGAAAAYKASCARLAAAPALLQRSVPVVCGALCHARQAQHVACMLQQQAGPSRRALTRCFVVLHSPPLASQTPGCLGSAAAPRTQWHRTGAASAGAGEGRYPAERTSGSSASPPCHSNRSGRWPRARQHCPVPAHPRRGRHPARCCRHSSEPSAGAASQPTAARQVSACLSAARWRSHAHGCCNGWAAHAASCCDQPRQPAGGGQRRWHGVRSGHW